MTTDLNPNCPVRVYEEIFEMSDSLPEERVAYADIFHVRLNHFVSVAFVPAFERPARNWPPSLLNAEYSSVITDAQQARQLTAALADYTVTAGRADEPSVAPFVVCGADETPPHSGVLFLVPSDSYADFARELAEVAETTPFLHDMRPASELQGYAFFRFLLTTVLPSPCFQEADRRKLLQPFAMK